jgi:hypothetical protein
MGEVSDLVREGGGELSSASDIVVGRASETLTGGCGTRNRSTERIPPLDQGRPPWIVRLLKLRAITGETLSNLFSSLRVFTGATARRPACPEVGERFLTRVFILFWGLQLLTPVSLYVL